MRVAILGVVIVLLGSSAAAATNRQSGDNIGTSAQDGGAASGDAIAGPSAGFSSSGDIRVRVTNRIGGSGDLPAAEAEPGAATVTNAQGQTNVASGEARGSSDLELFVGLGVSSWTDLGDVFAFALS